MKNTIKERVTEELIRLDLFNSRVPFFYYQNYLIINSELIRTLAMNCLSDTRKKISQCSVSEDAIWACCFIRRISNLSDEQMICSDIDKSLFKECLAISKHHIKEIEREFNMGMIINEDPCL